MDLFAESRGKNLRSVAPLSLRMRPRTLDEFVGQGHFLGPGKLLRRMLAADRLVSVLFYGPPGTGKTTLAAVIANHTASHFEEVNAAAAGVKEVRAILDSARERLGHGGKRTVLFLDEIHRFNRAQQDVLLADVEAGSIILIGATTENPFFAVNSALVSRSQIFQFVPLDQNDIKGLLRRAATDVDRGLGRYDVTIDDEAVEFLATTSDGDARRALTALEIAALSQLRESEIAGAGEAGQGKNPPVTITRAIAEESMQRKAIVYDTDGDQHFDAASALIKSMRGNDPNATIYWLARMLEAGEDPRFIARRIAIFASEDVGNADPHAITLAAAAATIVDRIGMPECKLTLAHAAIYMATAAKSRACTVALDEASKDVREGRTLPVPKHLQDAHYAGAKILGRGENAGYPRPEDDSLIEQSDFGVRSIYYRPEQVGHEIEIARRLLSGRDRPLPPDEPSPDPRE